VLQPKGPEPTNVSYIEGPANTRSLNLGIVIAENGTDPVAEQADLPSGEHALPLLRLSDWESNK
jgi:hypothetical protein